MRLSAAHFSPPDLDVLVVSDPLLLRWTNFLRFLPFDLCHERGAELVLDTLATPCRTVEKPETAAFIKPNDEERGSRSGALDVHVRGRRSSPLHKRSSRTREQRTSLLT